MVDKSPARNSHYFVALFCLKKIAFICIELSLGGRDDWHQFLSLTCTLRNSFAMCWYR